jgi:tryptophanyl-tRNA synthetase
MVEKRRSSMVSGIQPTGELMIGNYAGAVKNWVELQATHESLFFLADLHAITVPQDPADLQRRSFEFVALLLACGIDAQGGAIFLQSHVPAHTQLLWILNCVVPVGELQRMTQFKDKARGHAIIPHMGLFDYPVLMAADILLYGADLVPVGDDQQQHIEFTRRIARKFNGRYGDVFNVPEWYTPRSGARLMGLQTPTAKMSKSDRNADNYVALLDPPEVIRRKIKTAVTDSGSEIRCDDAKPGVSNLITLYAVVSGEDVASIQNRYAGRGYAEFKRHLAELIIDLLEPIQKRYRSIAANQALLAEVLRKGADKARERSEATLARVYEAVGFISARQDGRPLTGRRGTSRGRQPDISGPSRSAHQRRNVMETEEIRGLSMAAAADADADAECPTDCCDCCCCDTEEECLMEE